jgi:F-type H+-transporting ATPase subunit b
MSVLAAAEENILVPHTSELIFGGVAFLIVFLVLWRMLLPRIKKTLEDRADAIEGGLARAEEAQAEAARALAQYKEQLAEARHEGARLREEARQQGAVIIAEMREQAQAESRRITTQAHQQIEAERMQALASLRAEVGRLSVDLASKVVGESLEDDARQRRTVDRFLAELEETAERSDSTQGTR